ncbi:MAG: hypothetical protein C5B58_05155 [Acidobacteria bacterium]|nr:MAG: hypothetical protein C5B58_05155 [Acidobacteriota bacterium]
MSVPMPPNPTTGGRLALIRAIRGPIMLITLGVLIWIDHSGGTSFWRTWPVLLIVIGILKLAEMAGVN